MLLACDIGNSNIVAGLYDGAELRASWRLTSRLNATVDEYGVLLGTLLERSGVGRPSRSARPPSRPESGDAELGFRAPPVSTTATGPTDSAARDAGGGLAPRSDPASFAGSSDRSARAGASREINSAIISSVVPPLTPKLAAVVRALCGVEPLIVGPGVRTGLDVQYEDPREVGADRIVNAVGALSRHTPPLVIVDSGTAMTFDVILPPNVYLGGIIVPGLYISLDALATRTAKLPKVELHPTEHVVGRNTADSIRSGLYHGSAAMIDGLIQRISAEHAITPTVIATGGAAELLAGACRSIQFVEPDLTLHGLREIWQRNEPLS